MTYPACFDNKAQYTGWKRVAIIAKESCTPCTDCTKPYKRLMAEAGRCHPPEVRIQFGLIRRFDPPTKEEHL